MEITDVNKASSVVYDADRLMKWLTKYNVKLLLHGHKHRSFAAQVSYPKEPGVDVLTADTLHRISVVGMGGTGAKGTDNKLATITFKNSEMIIEFYRLYSDQSSPDQKCQEVRIKLWVIKMIRLLITDLDDTLYSWIGFFIPAFYEMVDELAVILKKDKEELLKEYRNVHQEKGSVEYPYATTLLPSVQAAYPNYTQQELVKILDPVFHRFNSSRKKNLRLYPNVMETLTKLCESLGIPIQRKKTVFIDCESWE